MVEQRLSRTQPRRVPGHQLVFLKNRRVVDPIPKRVPLHLVDHRNVLPATEAPSNLHPDEAVRLVQPRLSQHLQKLLLCPHIHSFSD